MLRIIILSIVVSFAAVPTARALENPYFPHPGAPAPASPAMQKLIKANLEYRAKVRDARTQYKFEVSTIQCLEAGYNSIYRVTLTDPAQPRLGGAYFDVTVNGGGAAGAAPFVTSVSEITLLR